MKLNRQFRPPDFWRWIQNNLPPSLEAVEMTIGYGTACNIYRRGEAPGAFKRHFEVQGDPVATVWSAEVRLNFPEWFSDFEDILRRWEAQTGIEATLTYWASPKDERPQTQERQ